MNKINAQDEYWFRFQLTFVVKINSGEEEEEREDIGETSTEE